METSFVFHYKPIGIFSDAQGQLALQLVVGSGQFLNSSEMYCMYMVTCNYKKDWMKNYREKVETPCFPL